MRLTFEVGMVTSHGDFHRTETDCRSQISMIPQLCYSSLDQPKALRSGFEWCPHLVAIELIVTVYGLF